MLRFVATCVVNLVGLMAFAGGPVKTSLTCYIHGDKSTAVALYKIENGEAVNLGFKRTDAKSSCVFNVDADKEAVYFLRKPSGHSFGFNHVIYLKPGDNKTIHLYLGKLSADFDSSVITKPNEETAYLQQWNKIINKIYSQGSNRGKREQFMEAYRQLEKDAGKIKNNSTTFNTHFNKLFAAKVNTDVLFVKAAAFFYFGERMNAGYDSSRIKDQFYQALDSQHFCDASVLASENGLSLLNFVMGYQLFQKSGSIDQMLAASNPEKAKRICNDTVRAVYLVEKMEQINNYEQFSTEITPFKELIVSAGLQKPYDEKHDQLYKYAKGAPAYNFSLYDAKDKLYSLSDFKGKVVVLDMWAMWCAPCLKEKPFFMQVEEAYHDRSDIVFVGISVDGSVKKDAWKAFVAKKGYQNIELLDEPNENISKYYNIEGIPRFMIFDKKGNIVTVNAPRPSLPEFKKLIDETLGEVTSTQPQPVTITGSFKQKVDAEVIIAAKEGTTGFLQAQYFIDRSAKDFSFRFPVSANVAYSLRVNILKKDGRHMKTDKTITVPLQLSAGDNLSYEIDVAALKANAIATTAKNSMVAISGKMLNPLFSGSVSFSKVADGDLRTVQNYGVKKGDPSYSFYLPIAEEGFYYLNTGGWRKRIYIKPGDVLQVNIDTRGGNPEWTSTTPENQKLDQWQQLIQPITSYGYERTAIDQKKLNADSFYNAYMQLQPAIEEFKKQPGATNNQHFNALFSTAMAVDQQLTALKLYYLLSRKKLANGFAMQAKEFVNVPADVQQIILQHPVSSSSLMQTGEGQEYLELYSKLTLLTIDENKKSKLTTAERLRHMMESMPTNELKAALLKQQLSQLEINNLSEFKETFAPHAKYASNPDVKNKYNEVYGNFAGDTAYIGKSSYNFSLPDAAGKMISMKDFKGKVVFIDVWATWCGPCRGQFPFLKEIEEEYADNKNMAFVSISIDKAEAKQKWMDMIKSENLGGVQLLDDMGKQFGRKYGIFSVPRFMLIDKNGKWKEVRCPLPEAKENLKRYLDKALAE